MDDDIWAEEEPDALQNIKRERENAGYLDGMTEGKNKAHQPGFDEGYIEGAALGLKVGRILGELQANGLKELESIALQDLSPQKLFCSEFYDSESRPKFQGNNHPLIAKWQEKCRLFSQSEQ